MSIAASMSAAALVTRICGVRGLLPRSLQTENALGCCAQQPERV